jgi:hypothetical protein
MPDGHIPSADELYARVVEARDALWEFGVYLSRHGMSNVPDQEDLVLPRFVRLADALRAIRPWIDSVQDYETKLALRDTQDIFDDITAGWGWEEVAKPDPERAAHLTKCAERAEGLNRRMMDAAASAHKSQDRSKSRSFRKLAAQAASGGIVPTMSPEEGEAQYKVAIDRLSREPRLGKCSPRFDENEARALEAVYRDLESSIKPPSIPAVRQPEERPPASRDWPPSGETDRPAARPEAAEQEAPPPAIDYEALATALRKQKKRNPAALVEYMANREEATVQEIARHVHGDPETSDSAIWNNAKRTSDALAAMGSPLWFRFASGRIYREISLK